MPLVPSTTTGARTWTDSYASSVSLCALVQVRASVMPISGAAALDFTVMSELPSNPTRSPALRLALLAVGVQTPALQLMFLVLAFEIVTDACAAAVESAIAA